MKCEGWLKKWLKNDKIVTLSELHAGGRWISLFYSYKCTKTTGLTSSHKSPVEPRTFLLWGDGTNHRIVLPHTIKIWVFQGAKPNHPGRTNGFILNNHQCVVACMRLLPPVTRRPGCGGFLCAPHAWENRKERCWEWEKGSGRAVNACVQPRYYLYLSPSSVTDVTHHLSGLFPGGVTLTESQVQTTLSRTPPLLTVPQWDTGGAVVSSRQVRIRSSKK